MMDYFGGCFPRCPRYLLVKFWITGTVMIPSNLDYPYYPEKTQNIRGPTHENVMILWATGSTACSSAHSYSVRVHNRSPPDQTPPPEAPSRSAELMQRRHDEPWPPSVASQDLERGLEGSVRSVVRTEKVIMPEVDSNAVRVATQPCRRGSRRWATEWSEIGRRFSPTEKTRWRRGSPVSFSLSLSRRPDGVA